MDALRNGLPIDLNLLDHMTNVALNSNQADEIQNALNALEEFTKRKDMFFISIDILKSNCSIFSKFYTLIGVLHQTSKTWNELDYCFQEDYKQFLFEIDTFFIENNITQLVEKTNEVIVEIAKLEYPDCIGFVSSVIDLGINNINWLKNGCIIFGMLAQEIHIYEKDVETNMRALEMKDSFIVDFPKILNQISKLLSFNDNNECILIGLNALKDCVKIINVEQILQNKILETICGYYLNQQCYFFISIQILEEILLTINNFTNENLIYFVHLFQIIVMSLIDVFGDDFDYSSESSFIDEFILTIPKFLLKLIKLNSLDIDQYMSKCLFWIYMITIENNKNLYDCMSFWKNLIKSGFTDLIKDYLPNLLIFIIRNISKPYEIITSYDSYNNIIYIYNNDKNNYFSSYFNMNDCILLLTEMDLNLSSSMFNEFYLEIENDFKNNNINIIKIDSFTWSFGCLYKYYQCKEIVEILIKFINLLIEIFNIVDNNNFQIQIIIDFLYISMKYNIVIESCANLLKIIIFKSITYMQSNNIELSTVSSHIFSILINNSYSILLTSDCDYLISKLIQTISNLNQSFSQQIILILFKNISILINNINDKFQQEKWSKVMLDIFFSIFNTNINELSDINSSNQNLIFLFRLAKVIGANIQLIIDQLFIKVNQTIIELYSLCNNLICQSNDDVYIMSIQNVKKSMINFIYAIIYNINDIKRIEHVFLPNTLMLLLDDYSCINLNNYKIIKLLSILIQREDKTIIPYLSQIIDKTTQTLNILYNDNYGCEQLWNNTLNFFENLSKYQFNIFLEINNQTFSHLIQTILYGCNSQSPQISKISLNSLLNIFESFKTIDNNTQCIFLIQSNFLNIFSSIFQLTCYPIHTCNIKHQIRVLYTLMSFKEYISIQELIEFFMNVYSFLSEDKIYDFLNNLFNDIQKNNFNDFNIKILNFTATLNNKPIEQYIKSMDKKEEFYVSDEKTENYLLKDTIIPYLEQIINKLNK